MSVYSSVLGVAVLLLHPWATHSFPPFHACPVPCLCQGGPVLNCSSLGLTSTPIPIPATAVSLNISHNALRSMAPLSYVKVKGLLHLWMDSNFLESLSLVLKNKRSGTRTLSSGEQKCRSWAPDLQLLSAERNHIKHLPRGLGCVRSLQILQMSYNQISEIGPADLTNSISLNELYLQHNQITNIHSCAFKGLQRLQVIDLSYNLLATIPVPAYQSLWNLNALVDVSFNKWRCDCNLKTLRKWIDFNTEMGDASWQVVCDSPSHHAGKDLLDLKDTDLTCPTHQHNTSSHYHNMIADEGMQILISCSSESQDFKQVQWWTPHGQVKDKEPELLIKDITKQHEGLYICVSGVQGEYISVFNLQVYTKDSGYRPRREAPNVIYEHMGKENTKSQRNFSLLRQTTKTQSQFVLAVCLSVIITFIIAFILGVLLRPVLDKLWRRIRSKRLSTPSPTTSRASSAGPHPYVNEGYSDADDQEQDIRVGSRVTFGGVTEVGNQSTNVPYYVTAENVHSDGSSESNTEVETAYEKRLKKSKISPETRQQALELDNHRGQVSNSRSDSQSEVNVLVTNSKTLTPSSDKVMEFEPIPDADNIRTKRGSSSSSSSSSSHSRQTLDRNVLSKVGESMEQSVDPPVDTVFVNETTTKGEIPEFTTEPFAEWSTRLTEQNVDDLNTDLWNDSGESFSFNEGSEKSSIRDHSNSAIGHPINEDTWRQGNVESPSYELNFNSHAHVDNLFDKEVPVDDVKLHKLSDTLSSSSSSESGDSEGPNSYTVNPELEEESEILHGSYKKTDSDRFHTPEDVTFNEKSLPVADILDRQETITLDPSDIHLTFTHEESVDEDMLTVDPPRNSEDLVFGSYTDVCLDTVPKIKHYIQFTHSKPHSSSQSSSLSSTERNVTPEIEVKSEAETTLETSYLKHINVSPEIIPKVKRYINFKKSEPHLPTLLPSPSSTKDALVEERRCSTSSEEEAKLTYEGDFRKIGISSDRVPKVKRYIEFKQIEASSTPTSASSTKKHISSTIPLTEYKKQFNSNFTPEGLPLYHVHPVYRSSQSRPNKDSVIDRSSSESSSEDEFTAYPRKLEFKEETQNNTGSITIQKNRDTFLNIDFDNSSSSTDVFEKKHNKGLTKLKVLSTRLFNRRENETDEKNAKTADLSYKCHSNLSVDNIQQTTSDDSFFGHIGLSLDEWKRPKKSLLFTITDPKSPNHLSSVHSSDRGNTHKEKAEFESRRSSQSSSSEGSFSSKDEVDILGQDSFLDQLPKVKRYLQFSHSDSHSQAQLPSPPLTTEKLNRLPKLERYIQFSHTEPFSTTQHFNKQTTSPNTAPELRRSSSSSDDDSEPISKKHNFFETVGVSLGTVPKVQRCIQFYQPESFSLTQSSLPVLSKNLETVVETSSSTQVLPNVKADPKGDNDYGQIGVCLDAVPKVERYVQFTQSKTHSSTLPSLSSSSSNSNVTPETEVKSEAKVDTSIGETSNLTETKKSPEGIPKVKRYIQFKQSEPHSLALPPSPSSSNKDVRVERSSTSSDDDIKLTTEKDNFREESLSSDGILKVKRYIAFKQFEPTTPTLYPVSSPSTKTEVRNGTGIKPMKSSSSSEDDVSPTLKENEFFGETGFSLDKLPQVRKYLQFKPSVSHLPLPNTYLNTPNVTPDDKTKSELRKPSTSSEDDLILTAQEDNFFKQTGASLDRIPKVKRYISFTQPDGQSSTQSTAVRSVNISGVVHETRRLSTSPKDVKPSNIDDDMNERTGESLVKIPKVKRYIKFTQSERLLGLSPIPVKSINATETELRGSITLAEDEVQSAPAENKTESRKHSTSSEDDVTLHAGASLNRIPKVKRYISFTQPESQSPTQSTAAQSVKISGVVHETRRLSTSPKEDVKPSNIDDNTNEGTGESLVKILKLKRYIKFTQSESFLDLSPIPVKSINVTETELRGSSTLAEDEVQSAPAENKTESRKHSTSSEDDVTLHACASLDRIPKVKRYIHFTQTEHPSPAPSTTADSAQRVISGTRTRKSSTSSEEDFKPSTNYDYNIYGQTGASFNQLPKVRTYIKFKQHDYSTIEDNMKLSRFSYNTSVKSDSTPTAKAGMEKAWSSLSSKAQPTISIMKGSALVIKAETESPRSEFGFKDNVSTREATGGLEQTGLKPQLSKSSYMPSDNRDLAGCVVMVSPSPQNEPPAVPQTPPPPLEQEEAKEYLRDNSQVRQRQERRRLLQQRRKAMDDFSISSLITSSSSTQEGNKQNSSSLVDYGGAYSNASVLNTVTSRRTEKSEGLALQGLKTKNISALRSKAQVDSVDTKYKEFLI